jgi:hypothetical protein
VLVSRYCDSQEGVERRAQGIVTDLVDGGYVLKEKAGAATVTGSRSVNRCVTRSVRERTVGEILDLLVRADSTSVATRSGQSLR